MLPGTPNTPRVDLLPEEGNFVIQGVSHPENATEFYTPLSEWIEQLREKKEIKTQKEKKKLTLTFLFRFLNTASLKAIGRICISFASLEKFYDCSIEWLYEENDFDVRDVGEDIFSLLNLSIPVAVKEIPEPADLHPLLKR